MQIVIDAKTGKISSTESHAGVVGFISWRRLADMFLYSGEVNPNEELISYRLSEDGIHFKVAIFKRALADGGAPK